MDKLLTVFTPTFNRAYLLPRLYNSLRTQTNADFEWLVIDDGSTDETAALVRHWQCEDAVSIRYVYQDNAGKHVAHNTALSHCKGELFMCVDSDDYLQEDAVDVITRAWERERTNPVVCGIVGPKSFVNRVGDEPQWPVVAYCTLLDLAAKHRYQGETYIVLRTSVFRDFPFPMFAGEKFVTESVIYDQISQKHQVRLLRDALYSCEYLADGYTSEGMRLFAKNPKGYSYFLRQRVYLHPALLERAKYAGQYMAWCAVFALVREGLGIMVVVGWLLCPRYTSRFRQIYDELQGKN